MTCKNSQKASENVYYIEAKCYILLFLTGIRKLVSVLAQCQKIFGRKREEVAGGWRKLHKEELRNLYTSPNVIRVIK
jgi:hypothetical protein